MEALKAATELLKALIWPALILFFAFFYQHEFLSILQTRELKVGAGGIEIGQAVETLQTAQAGIDQIFQRWAQASPQDQPKIRADLQRYLTQDLGQLGAQLSVAAAATAPTAATGAAAPAITAVAAPALAAPGLSAADRERQGFRDLAARNVDAALANFDRAYALYPTLHNVEEIRRILRERSAALKGNDAAWKQLYDDILKNYAWGMPPDVRDKFQSVIKAS
jgi:hypothetical protein